MWIIIYIHCKCVCVSLCGMYTYPFPLDPTKSQTKPNENTGLSWAAEPKANINRANLAGGFSPLYLVGGWALSLWKIWFRQLGWCHSQYQWKNKKSCSRKTTNQLWLHSLATCRHSNTSISTRKVTQVHLTSYGYRDSAAIQPFCSWESLSVAPWHWQYHLNQP